MTLIFFMMVFMSHLSLNQILKLMMFISKLFSVVVMFSLLMTSVACAVGLGVITSSIDFSFQNLNFWNLFDF
jgi:hypothetical protein